MDQYVIDAVQEITQALADIQEDALEGDLHLAVRLVDDLPESISKLQDLIRTMFLSRYD